MCGIAGYFNLGLREEERVPLLKAMCDTIQHRGPDDQGFFADASVGLSMRRLSIIDLAGGHQPIVNAKGTKHIVFNGEIYNFRELREALIRKGHSFTTHSDTEVILKQFEEEGEACVHRFNGMFAFAIWDQEKRSLFIARDRMGVKPLYYYWDGKTLLFGSEIKALLATGRVPRELNEQAVWDYLTFRFVPQPETIWRGIRKLLPGHSLTISLPDGEPRIVRYWRIPYRDSSAINGQSDYQAEFDGLFLDAVRLRLIADVPVGILLSGGLDSSAVAAAVSEVHKGRIDTFSVAFADSPSTNELPYARQVAAKVGANHNEIVIGKREFLDFLPQCAHFMDEPMADLASIPLHFVSSLARQRVKVVLSGEGSDEVLAGYDFERQSRYWNMVRLARWLPAWLRKPMAKRHGKLGSLMSRAEAPLLEGMYRNPPTMTNYLDSREKAAFFRGSTGLQDSMDVLRKDLEGMEFRDPLHLSLYLYCQSWLVEDLLMKADRMTMANSIELRVPFLDYRLVEWAARAPARVKVAKGPDGRLETKHVLREFARNRLPREIIDRPKQGFPVPVYDWIRGDLKPWVEERLLSGGSWVNRYFERKPLEDAVRRWQGGGIRDQHRIWNLLILQIWAEKWMEA